MSGLGLYIHIPFCLQKCPYCDFFSAAYSDRAAYAYADAVIRNAEHYKERYDTVYFGGGTPSAAWRDVCRIVGKLKLADGAEITVEANPNTITRESLSWMKNSGINRLSVGVQSLSNAELRALGRSHTSEDASNSIKLALECGFKNISVDLMLGIPGQTPDSVRRSIKILTGLNITHVSAYMLKIEPNTPFARTANPPDENLTAQIYLAAASALEEHGFMQYEISNFAKKDRECRHNLKYWKSEEYLGIGAAAHSFYDGERFFVIGDVREFTKANIQQVIITEKRSADTAAGSFEEYAMLKLRLVEGLTFAECGGFGVGKDALLKRCRLVPPDYLRITDRGVAITQEGFLVSNQIINKLITEPAEQFLPT
ncbi:MAG: radical SAM family heme chaperone HemW [Oscillospiraceae bacterium]|jgi:oxygen-independent coproporphyrinogen-3 oxidase|nr:radical SAM family heme chaperone HemW [Oscillospiraceae bacterium]